MSASAPVRSRLHLPGPGLAGCIFIGVERDTRGLALTGSQRFNYYPASPFPMVSWIFHGQLRMVLDPQAPAEPVLGDPLPQVVLSGPYRRPSASWSPGPVHALSVSFHPQGLARLLGIRLEDQLDAIVPLESVAAGEARDALLGALVDDGRPPFRRVEAVLGPLWRELNPDTGADIRGWLSSLAARAAFSTAGTGLRQLQRRIKDWTGQSDRDLRLYARVEHVLARVAAGPEDRTPDLAELAAETGFADQSHMGRDVRRVTGLSPKRLTSLIRNEEAFWLYRLLEGHLRSGAAGTGGQASSAPD